jgi:hypothetical protein
MPELESSIRALISRYLAGQIDVDTLNDLLPDGWDTDAARDPDATDLVVRAVGYVAGYQAGDRTEDELRGLLAGVLSTVLVEYETEAPDLMTVLATASSRTIPVSVEGDSSLGAEFEREASQHPRTEHQTTTALLDPPRSR